MTGIKKRSFPEQISDRSSLIFALALIALTSLTFTMPACAQVTVAIYPSSQDVYANSTFSIYVDIGSTTPFVGAQLDIQFDQELIIADKLEEGNLFVRDSVPHLFNKGSIDNSAGSITGSYAVTFGGSDISEPGTFVKIDCTALCKEGYCPLDLSNVIISDSRGQSIPVTVTNGGVFIHSEVGDQPDTNESGSGLENGAAGGAGGGGGGSGTSEDAANIYMKEAKNVNVLSNTSVIYQFTEQENPVTSITYYSLKNAGQITSTIEVLNNTSLSASYVPPGTVYKNINIWVGKKGYATEENIREAVVGFKVQKKWMEENGFDAGSIRMYRFNEGNWSELQTNIAGEDAGFVFFEADTPGFSPFAITAFALATSDTQSNYNDFMNMKTGTYEIIESSGLQNEASAGGQDNSDGEALGQNSALLLIVFLIVVAAINVFLREE